MIRTKAVTEIPLRFYSFHLRFFSSTQGDGAHSGLQGVSPSPSPTLSRGPTRAPAQLSSCLPARSGAATNPTPRPPSDLRACKVLIGAHRSLR
eukprot:COSAG01_NODE_2388_length_7779_cov_127.916384_2_plen_93_part_00